MKGSLTQPVEAADSTDNDLVHEVIGNKEDAANETANEASVIGLLRAIIARLVTLTTTGLAAAVSVIDGFHDVPTADSTDNNQMRDALGNKEDAANETVDEASVIGMIRAIIARLTTFGSAALATSADLATVDGYHDVPAADAADNAQARDVSGNKEDAAAETADVVSLVGLARAIIAKVNGGALTTYPDAAAGAALTAGAANVYGALVSVSGALGANSRLGFLDFDTPAVAIEPTQWELSYDGGASIVATGVIGFDTAVGTYPPIDLSGKGGIIPSGETLQLRIRSATGGTTCNAHLSTMPAL